MADRNHLSPLTDLAARRLDRRTFLRGLMATGGVLAVPGLAACGGDEESGGGTGGTTGGGGDVGTVSVGSNYSNQTARPAMQSVFDQFEQSVGGTVEVNTIEHDAYQEQINNYLQAGPEDVFAWFAGFRMQFFAERGLASPISDVWSEVEDNMTDALKQASTAQGEQYFMPFYYYPWAVFYRKSVFDDNGYDIPTTLDEFTSLAEQMQSDGLIPIAFADREGWPAMGTFDYLNLRTNGYDFHTSLLAGEESWDSDPVRQVFETWRELLPFHQENALGRDWQEAAQTLANGETGMYLLGLFLGQAIPEDTRDDVDFFAFPEINPEFGQDTVEAPIDGWMLSTDPSNPDGAKEMLAYLGGAEAQETYIASDPTVIAANDQADTSNYSALQQKSVELINAASHISQYMDRDTRPDFASTVMIPSLQSFLRAPDTIDSILTSIEEQKQSIFST